MKKTIVILIILLVITNAISIFIGYNLGINKNKMNANANKKSETIKSNGETEKQVEITLDNWQDYIELEDIEETNTDDFGDITGTVKYTILKFKENVIKSEDVKLKLEFINEKEEQFKEQITGIYDGSDDFFRMNYKLRGMNKINNSFESKQYDYRVSINDFDVINAKGTVYINQ